MHKQAVKIKMHNKQHRFPVHYNGTRHPVIKKSQWRRYPPIKYEDYQKLVYRNPKRFTALSYWIYRPRWWSNIHAKSNIRVNKNLNPYYHRTYRGALRMQQSYKNQIPLAYTQSGWMAVQKKNELRFRRGIWSTWSWFANIWTYQKRKPRNFRWLKSLSRGFLRQNKAILHNDTEGYIYYLQKLIFKTAKDKNSGKPQPRSPAFLFSPYSPPKVKKKQVKKVIKTRNTAFRRKVRVYNLRFLRMPVRRKPSPRSYSVVVRSSRGNYFITLVKRSGGVAKVWSSGQLKIKTSKRRRNLQVYEQLLQGLVRYLKTRRVRKLNVVKFCIFKTQMRNAINDQHIRAFNHIFFSNAKIKIRRILVKIAQPHGILPRAPKLRRK